VLVQNMADLYEMAGVPQGLVPFQTSVAQYKSQFNMTLEKPKTAGAVDGPALKLTPKTPGELTATMYLWVDADSGLPYRTTLEAGSASITTTIGQVSVNPVLTEKDFVFQPPKGAQIMEVPFERSQK
jgi:outer membrane lipoprotein-sorting protein